MLKKIILVAALAMALTACTNDDSDPITVPSSASTTTTVTTTTTAAPVEKPAEKITTTTTTATASESETETTTTTSEVTTTTTAATPTTAAPTTTTAAPKPSVTFAATSKTVYATTYVPFRTTPTDNGTIICYISPNTSATVTSVSSDNKWYGVTYNGMKGYALTSQTTTTAPKVTSTTTTTTTAKVTQPAKNKTALDIAFEALVKGNSTAQQRELVRQYAIGLAMNNPNWKANGCVLDESLYPFVDANGNPCFDESVADDWGNSQFMGQIATDYYTQCYRAKAATLETLAQRLRADFNDYGKDACTRGRYNLAFYKNKRRSLEKDGYEYYCFTSMKG